MGCIKTDQMRGIIAIKRIGKVRIILRDSIIDIYTAVISNLEKIGLMKNSIFHSILIIFLTLSFSQNLIAQVSNQQYLSHENYLARNGNLPFKSSVHSVEFCRFSNSSEVTLDITRLTPQSISNTEIKAGQLSNVNLIFPYERNLSFINNSNHLAPFYSPNPTPSVGKTIGKFFLGFLAGAAIGTSIFAIASSEEKMEYVPGVGTVGTGTRDTSMDFMGPVLILGGGLLGGIMFAIKW